MNTTYGYKKQVKSVMSSSKHTLALLMSKLRVWLEYGWSMVRVWLQRDYGSLIARLRLTHSEITAHSQRGYGSLIARLRFTISMLLLLTLGSVSVWGQETPDYSGKYYIASAGYNVETPANNFYLCPTEGWIYYRPDNNWSEDGSTYPNPFLTTYKCKTNDYHSGDPSNAVWYIEKHPTQDFYYIRHASDGKYVISNGKIDGTSNANRMRVHLETVAPEDLDDKALFSIEQYSTYLVISPKSSDGWNGDYKWYTVNNGNKNDLKGNESNGGPTGHTATGGILGLYSKGDGNAKFYLEIPSPVISQDPSTLNISISCDWTGINIRYTTNGTEPTKTSTLYEGEFLPGIGATTIKAKAFNSSGDVSSATTSLELTKNAAPSISVNMSTKKATISTSVDGGTIYYTTNGNNPTVSSSVYSAPISFTKPTIIKAIVGKEGYAPSAVTTKTIIKVATPTIYDNGNLSIAITSATVGASIYYTTDGSTPTTASSLYSVPLTNMDGKTIKAIAVMADNFDSDVATYGPVSFSCAQPNIRRTGIDNFTLTCTNPTSGVTIYYTTNGNTPSTSDSHVASGGTVSFDSSQLPLTVKAIAVADDFLNSSVATLTISNDGMSGSGTPADPYQIALDSDLSIFVTKVTGGEASAYYIVTSNINASGMAEINTPFTGIFDGNGYIISNLGHALFNSVNGGTVKNVILDNVNISSGTNVGAIANTVTGISANKASIYNCGVLSGSISGSESVGSIVGVLGDNSNNDNCYARVINCYSYATIGGGSNVGGIVGYNSFASASNNLRTMVMNCMFYGNITGGTNKAPIYNGRNITNVGTNGLANYNYYYSGSIFNGGIDTYNCALAADERYLTRFEFYRRLLNSNGELAAWYATGSTENRSEMYKWVLLPSSYGTEHPFPVLAPQGIYPSVVNLDTDNAPMTDEPNKGKNMGTLSVTIQSGNGAVFSAPGGASIKTNHLDLTITDKDYDHFNYNYRKVQFPYYNEVGTGNYTDDLVVTGWKIVSISGGTSGNYSTGEDVTFTDGELTATPYNFADRKCTNKDLYSVSKRIFSQGAYWDVPDGVTSITIEPYWGKAAYLCDKYWNVVYSKDHKTTYNVTTMGEHYNDGNDYFIEDTWQKVYNTLDNAVTALSSNASHSVYDYAVVLVGNYHLVKQSASIKDVKTPFTVMSADFDRDNEPDYSFILQFSSRQNTAPIRFDFINIPGLGMAQKSYEATSMPNVGIFKPNGWFEITNTATILLGQFEYDRGAKADSPLILHGGIIEQIVSNNDKTDFNHTQYIHFGSNVWCANFSPGIHQDDTRATKHVPVSVTGGEYNEFHLTGTYRADAVIYDDNAECYIHGGKFGEVTGTGLEGIGNPTSHTNGNITWVIDQADIDSFFGGGINAAKPSQGNIYTEITNSNVTLFCGGPKFGDMQNGKTVTSKATDCTFGTFFGAGYGGNSYNRFSPQNKTDAVNYDWNTWINSNYTCSYSSDTDKNGISTNFAYEFIPMSGGMSTNVARLFVNYISFSLATTGNVTSTLTGCKVTGNFYGGGSLGKVNGDATSILTNCTLEHNAFGAGFSATLPTVEVMATGGFKTEPEYDPDGGVYSKGVFPSTTTYNWRQAASPGIDKDNHILYTTADLTTLGTVTGKATLTINGTTTVAESVYGGGEESSVGGDTEVNVTGGTIGTTGKGGATWGNIFGGGKGKEDDVAAGQVKGNTNINISGSPYIIHNVYGGGAYGSVGTFTYDNTTGFPNSCAENTGVANITITGGTFGSNGKENGMVFGSSRGLEGDPETNEYVDKMAWVGNTNVVIGTENAESNTTPVIKGSVYGGGENGHNYQNAHVTVHSGTIGITDRNTDGGARYPYRGNVYGGGCGTDTYSIGEGDNEKKYYDFNAGIVLGNTLVDIDGGHIVHNVYGGGAMGSVGKFTLVDEAYNTEHSDAQLPVGMPISCAANTGLCTINISGGKIGVTDATMKGHGNDGPDDCGHVFGAGRGTSADPEKYPNVEYCAFFNNTQLNISGKALICGSVYGGSESGHVLNNTNVTMSGGQVGCGVGQSTAYTDDEFNSSSLNGTAHWDYTAGGAGAPYDQYAGTPGYDAKGGATTATDGRTFFGNVFAGGSGYYPYAPGKWLKSAGHIKGTASVTISGGHILNNLYGGCEMADIEGAVTVTMTGGTVGVPRSNEAITQNPNYGNVYGGGMGDKRIFFNTSTNVASTTINISNGKVFGAVYGGGEDGHVMGAAVTTISQPEGKTTVIGCDGQSGYDGNVFGAGQGHYGALTSGVVGGNATLNVQGGTINGSVYGGGRIASVGTHFAMATIEDPDNPGQQIPNPEYGQMTDGDDHGCLTVNLTGGTIMQNVYGGCMGTTEGLDYGVSKNVAVNLNKDVDDAAKGCIVLGPIFGCNNVNSSPEGTSTVHIYKTQRNGASRITNTAEVTNAKVNGTKDANGEYVLNTFDVPAVYGGGNLAAYTPKDENGTTNVIIDGCSRTSIGQVYGGGNAASTPATSVTINGTFEIGELFGGGNGKDAIDENTPNPGANVGYKDYHLVEDQFPTKEDRVDGDAFAEYRYGSGLANVTVKGGTIHRVFGGSNTKGNVRKTALTMLEEVSDGGVPVCEFHVDEAYGGGKSAPMDAEAKLLMACIPGLEEVYGGAQAADIKDNVTLTITNGTFDRVFGGNNLSGTISGSITVNIEEVGCRPIIIGELYGGGNLAAYSIYGYNDDSTPKTSGENPFKDPEVNVKSFTSIGTVFGGGYGEGALMVGSPTVNINEVADPTSEAQNKEYKVPDPDFPDDPEKATTHYYSDYAGETKTIAGHDVILPSHVKGKMGSIHSVFGGGNAAKVMGNTTVNIGTAIGDDIYIVVPVAEGTDLTDGGYYTKSGDTYTPASGTAVEGVTYYKKYTVLGVDIRDNIYGGGNNAEVTGNANVNIGKKKTE